MSELVRLEQQGRVGIVTIDRPKALNALDRDVIAAFAAVLDRVEAGIAAGRGVGAGSDASAGVRAGAGEGKGTAADAPIGALVVTGAGRAFVAGADVAAMRTMTPLEGEAFSALAHRVFGRLEMLPIPTIAAVNGFALGGGCELALACDFAFAAREAKIGQPETKLGLIPGFGGTSRLVRRVGIAWAKQLVLVGDPIDAEEALRIGLVNRVYEAAELLPAAIAAAEAAAARAPVATRLAKQVMQEGQDADVRAAHALEMRAFGLVFASDDRIEGTSAFVEKREARFAGR